MSPLSPQTKAEIAKHLEEEPGAVLDYIAREHGVSLADVIACLPADQARTVDGALFDTVMGDISGWGEITFIVHTEDIILEAKGPLPAGKKAHGFYNLSGGPIGGHLKDGNCAAIAFVSRPLFTSQTKSVQFFNKEGGCMFKIYLGRDENRDLVASQVTAFEALRKRLCAEAA